MEIDKVKKLVELKTSQIPNLNVIWETEDTGHLTIHGLKRSTILQKELLLIIVNAIECYLVES